MTKVVPLVVYLGEERVVIGEAQVRGTDGTATAAIWGSDPRSEALARELHIPVRCSFHFSLPDELTGAELVMTVDDQEE